MSMLGLVVATNIFQMYIFWELVGVSSYLLIGFYYTKKEAIAASKKAFIVTRFADLGFLIGILIYGFYTGSFSFTPDSAVIGSAKVFLPIALGLMFIGGAGKSAMFPLHIWLPDAMEGPTPFGTDTRCDHGRRRCLPGGEDVPAVHRIRSRSPAHHSIRRCVHGPLRCGGSMRTERYQESPGFQYDIPDRIHDSGFGRLHIGRPSRGRTRIHGFHVPSFHARHVQGSFTHAMFKALLFLGAGCIIHAVHSNEMSAMGGLRKYMPVTHVTFLVACLAIAGIWPLSGFFSKDEILAACFGFSPVMGWVMTFIAGLTAFYMFRLYYCIFWGKENKELHAEHTPHEAPLTMTIPLIFLAVVTLFAGWIPFGEFVSSNGQAYHIHIDWAVAATSLCVAAAGIAIATWMYLREDRKVADGLAAKFSGLHKAAYHRFYIDEIYQFVTHRIIFACISTPIAWFDRHVVDGFMNMLAWLSNQCSWFIKGMQSGNVQKYGIWFLGGALGLTVILLLI